MEVLVKLLDNFPADLVDKDKFLTPAMPGDAGYDLVSAEDVTLLPGERRLIRTGVAVALPMRKERVLEWTTDSQEDEFTFEDEVAEMQIRPRSGLALKQGLTITNSPGTVDSGFRGEICVIAQNTQPVLTVDDLLTLTNTFDHEHLTDWLDIIANREDRQIIINRGDRIAQAVFTRVVQPRFVVTDELPESTRGAQGYGSTGVAANV